MIIQKFGGIAMKDEAMRMKCIEHIKTGIEQYGKVVIVVSAIGRLGDPYATDSLLKLNGGIFSDMQQETLLRRVESL